MKAFTFVRPTTLEEAAKAVAVKGSVLKAGGIDLLDRMKERVDEPERVVWLGDVKRDEMVPELNYAWNIEYQEGHVTSFTNESGPFRVLKIGALATLAELARSAAVRERCPALAEAAALAASPQLRQRATIGGNLGQHTRCGYYRHASFPCFKRGDPTCPVLDDGAVQDTAAVFGNRQCASAHLSSLAPVFAAHEARLTIVGPKGGTALSIEEAFATSPQRGHRSDLSLGPSDVIEMIDMAVQSGRRSAYEEVRQKAAFDWALVSTCVRLDMDGDKVRAAGVWLGSVAPTPWHAEAAEKALVGKPLTDATIAAAAEAAVAGATPLPGNAYKLDLVKVVVRRALERLRAGK